MSLDLDVYLEQSGAVLRGHFRLSSGRHSDMYVEKFRILEQPEVLGVLCAELATRAESLSPDVVVGPTTGGIILAFEIARRLKIGALYAERENGARVFRRDARLAPNARVLVVDDVLTTGTSVREVLELVRSKGGDPVGVAVLIDRSNGEIDFGCPLIAAHRVQARTFDPDSLPAWLAAIPVQEPGTRFQSGTA